MRPITAVSIVLMTASAPLHAGRAQATTSPSARLAGVVVGNGQPVGAAIVRLTTADSQHTVLEDTSRFDGAFRFESVPSGRYQLQVRRIGYVGRRVELNVGDTSMDTLRLQLEPFASQCSSALSPAVQVEVRDAATGIDLALGSRLEISSEGHAFVGRVATPDTARTSVLAAGGELPGTYHVMVSRPGFQNWVKDKVVVRNGLCGLYTVYLTADLLRDRSRIAQADSIPR
jgi:hypothetical protein